MEGCGLSAAPTAAATLWVDIGTTHVCTSSASVAGLGDPPELLSRIRDNIFTLYAICYHVVTSFFVDLNVLYFRLAINVILRYSEMT